MKNILFILGVFLLMTSFITAPLKQKKEEKKIASCRLQLIRLVCEQSEGYATPDAIYFIINGEEVKDRILMSPTASDNVRSEVSFLSMSAVPLDKPLKFELWDDDTWDSDDFLGEHTFTCADEGAGEKYALFTNDCARYKLWYKVF